MAAKMLQGIVLAMPCHDPMPDATQRPACPIGKVTQREDVLHEMWYEPERVDQFRGEIGM